MYAMIQKTVFGSIKVRVNFYNNVHHIEGILRVENVGTVWLHIAKKDTGKTKVGPENGN